MRRVTIGRLLLSVDWCTYDRTSLCVAADDENDIWRVPEPQASYSVHQSGALPVAQSLEASHKPQLVLEGQSADVHAVAVHPRQPTAFATVCDDGCIYLWDTDQRQVLPPSPFEVRRAFVDKRAARRSSSQRRTLHQSGSGGEVLKGRTCAFGADGSLLAHGSSGVVSGGGGKSTNADQGGVLSVYWIDPAIFAPEPTEASTGLELEADAEGVADTAAPVAPCLIFQDKIAEKALECMRFSPDGQLLAVGCHDTNIYVFDVSANTAAADAQLALRCVITQNASAVTSLDWSTPAHNVRVLQSTSSSYELLYRHRLDRARECLTRACVVTTDWHVPFVPSLF